ncbi:oxidoreductase [Pseudomonas oryzihabitans]|uniref:oxidoreductase n=1 Tax=Pseudomonas oryzihabitans TaxID=47885 RepID=UPI0011A6EA28|nr:oxidoreductase [Pseudomonas psychrotolerans]
MKKTWLITGCSSGLGQHLAVAAAARGDNVVATARDPAILQPLTRQFPDNLKAVRLDVTDASAAAAAIAFAQQAFGGLDVLVNNAGVGFIGAVEEAEPSEYRPVFEVNVFGLIEMTRLALPALRERGSGRIVNLSSGAGLSGGPGSGYYSASKFAVEGFSESLAREVEPLGLRVIIVEPGPFRTDFLGRSIALAKQVIGAYADTAGRRRAYRDSNDGRQAGDPRKAAAVILQAVEAANPPLHLPLGPVAYDIAEHKLSSLRADMDAWRAIARHTDFD